MRRDELIALFLALLIATVLGEAYLLSRVF
jgi:hypothetical protein